ncbi:MAG: DUF503 domain-containing protein [Cyanobacteria bacterium NC_groundwater_1444_Ag_S-0.65um_54_12]|nr:DUF503 domain-containing protein [Cyanobacteria bacterium NC_groundwater_1444_Ag_S-0.65um_54_12]
MVIGAALLRLHLPGATSLKDKRQIVRSVIARLQNKFSIAVAEVGNQDKWQIAEIGIAVVANDSSHIQGVLAKAVDLVANGHWEAELLDYETEIIYLFQD